MANLLAKNGKIIGGVPQDGYVEYSTSEKIVGKWIDGKPLYEKSFTATTPNISGAVTVITDNFFNTTYINLRDIKGVVQSTWPIGYYVGGTTPKYISASLGSTGINMSVSTDYYEKSVVLTLIYTKKSD